MSERLVTLLAPHLAHDLWPVTRWISGALVVPCFWFKSGSERERTRPCISSDLQNDSLTVSPLLWWGEPVRGREGFPCFAGKGEVPVPEVRAQAQGAVVSGTRLHSRSVRHAFGPGICELGWERCVFSYPVWLLFLLPLTHQHGRNGMHSSGCAKH